MADKNYAEYISIEEANSAAGRMAKTNDALKSKLEEISKEMNEMNSKYDSDVGRETVDRFNRLKVPFDQYYARVKGFVEFIQNDVTEAYTRSESTIRVNLGNIQDSKASAQ